MKEKRGAAGRGGATAPNQRKTGEWSEAAVRVLRERYLLRDADGNIVETPDDLCWRVATAVAGAESEWQAKTGVTPEAMAEQFYNVMVEHKFLPNSPTLMNAGKGNNLQLSACYVVPVDDSLAGIFDGVKHAALIHQSGGGCISGDAHVFTTFCGVEAISTLYARVRATGQAEVLQGDHAVMDVRDLGIMTMALNPEHGSYERAQVTHLWRYDVPLDDQVRVRGANGLEVTTSRWHPFMVFGGTSLIERRADELRPGDVLPVPNPSVRLQWPHTSYKTIAGITLDEEIAWLLGYYLGDGSLGFAKVPESEPRRETLRWRLFGGRTASLEHAGDILSRRFDVHLSVHQDSRGLYSLTTTNSGFISQFRSLLPLEPGPKLDLPFPEMIAKSPLSVVGAFLAGLVDSDGYVDTTRDRVTFTTQAQQLSAKVHTLCSLLGLAPSTRTRQPHGKGRSVVYEVKLAAEPRVDDLRTLIGPYLNDSLKADRLASTRGRHEHSTSSRLPIPFSAIEDILQSIGMVTDTTPIHRHPVLVGETEIWLHRWKEGQGVNSEKLAQLVAALRPQVDPRHQSRLDVLEHLAQGATTVTAVEAPETCVPFYDFTVSDHSTYLAGTNGLTAIHNTGFSFSRLRPAGSTVASTHGVASGPVSFMRIFDQATEAVKQGGSRRGANMGILRVDHPDVLQFIDCKRDGSVTNFNISVAITDEFMRALEADGEYDLVDPHSGKVVQHLRAKDVMDSIVSAAWATGDPGLVFLDRANRSTANPTPDIEMLEATNPCFTGDTRVWTDRGPMRFDVLVGKDVSVLTQTESGELVWRSMTNIHVTRHDVEVYQVDLESAITGALGTFRATAEHKLWLADGSTTTVSQLQSGDHLSSAYRLANGRLVNSSANAMPELGPVNHSVVAVKRAGVEDVYCGTVDETHRFFIVTEDHGGVLVANCGEQYLGPYDACNLGSINLGIFVQDGEIDWTELERVTRLTTRFLDDVIEINPFPLPEVHAKVHANRRIGLGVMGWAEMLFELGLAYDSDEAISLGERVMTQIKDWATDESHKMAEERGEFPNFSRSIYKEGQKLRNSTCTTVAPTGSISILADCSSGIEPIFALAFQHRVKQPDGSYRVLDFVNPFFKRALEESGVEDKTAVLEYVKSHGSLHGHPAGEDSALKPYVTAHEIAPDWHIRMQASFQKGVQNSISKTINLPNSATYDDVRNAYLLAWNLGCLGITIFRDGSKGEQVLNVGVKEQEQKAATPASTAVTAVAESSPEVESPVVAAVPAAPAAPLARSAPLAPRSSTYPGGIKPRPEVMSGYTRQVRAPEGTVNITLNSDVDGLFEVFVNVGKAGSDVSALAEALGRLISRFLQIDSPLTQDQRAVEIARQLSAIGGSTSIGFGPNRVRSLPDAVARALDLHLSQAAPTVDGSGDPPQAEEAEEDHVSGGSTGNEVIHTAGHVNGHGGFHPATHALYTVTGNLCPQCGNNTLYMEEGCKKCVSCGHSEC